jgi:hypothetical protein
VPDTPAWSLSGAAGAPISLRDVNQQVEGAYRAILDAAVEKVPVTCRCGRSCGRQERRKQAGWMNYGNLFKNQRACLAVAS